MQTVQQIVAPERLHNFSSFLFAFLHSHILRDEICYLVKPAIFITRIRTHSTQILSRSSLTCCPWKIATHIGMVCGRPYAHNAKQNRHHTNENEVCNMYVDIAIFGLHFDGDCRFFLSCDALLNHATSPNSHKYSHFSVLIIHIIINIMHWSCVCPLPLSLLLWIQHAKLFAVCFLKFASPANRRSLLSLSLTFDGPVAHTHTACCYHIT